MRIFLFISLLAVLAALVLRERYWRGLTEPLAVENQRLAHALEETANRADRAEKALAALARGSSSSARPTSPTLASTSPAPKPTDAAQTRSLTWQERYQNARQAAQTR